MESHRILLAEDDIDFSELLKISLKNEGYVVDVVSNQKSVISHLNAAEYDLLILDLFLEGLDSTNIIPEIQKELSYLPIIVLSAKATVENAVKAMHQGATTFVKKDIGINSIINKISRYVPNEHYQDAEDLSVFDSLGLIGNSPKMNKLKHIILTLRDVNIPILLSGESGTGKEVAAKALHLVSDRKNNNFMAINCGAIPDSLLEAELFGHKKGAFTDAKSDKKGLFEVCTDGTLLLDEIGDMPMNLQVKLLRVLQEKEVRPLGSTNTKSVNTCVIAASNKDLEKEVECGRFREDLFYRLNIINIHLPALRDRIEDFEDLLSFFIDDANLKFNKNFSPPSKIEMKRLKYYSWPGNIRQLKNCTQRAVVLSEGTDLEISLMLNPVKTRNDDRSFNELRHGMNSLNLTEAKNQFEREYIENLLELSKGNITDAARLAGRYRGDIYRLISKHDCIRVNA